jgi:hypothetical protein
MINTPILPPERPFYIDQDGDICDANGWLVCCPARDVWPDGDNAHAKDLLMVLNRRAVSFEEHNRLVEKAVRAALERAALIARRYGSRHEPHGHAAMGDDEVKVLASCQITKAIHKLASDPAEVAAIIKKAGGDRG